MLTPLVRTLAVAPAARRAPWDRWDAALVVVGVAFFAAMLVHKLATFYALGYSGDIFVETEIARSWLTPGRHVFDDNCNGNHLSIHTFFLLIPLGVFVKPFGAPALLVVLALSFGASVVTAGRILRRLDVPGPAAVAIAALVVAMPFSVWCLEDPLVGWNSEMLEPALALWLFHALLARSRISTAAACATLIAVKEDATLLAAAVAAIALIETALAPTSPSDAERPRANRAALAVIGAAAIALPLFLLIMKTAPRAPYAHGNFDRLPESYRSGATGPASLALFVLTHVSTWIGSSTASDWASAIFVATFCAIALRPHFAPIGFVLTLVPWLLGVRDLMTWPARFAPVVAFAWCTTLVVAASLCATARSLAALDRERPLARRPATWALAVGGCVAVATIVFCFDAQLARKPVAIAFYRLAAESIYTPEERETADALFARYVRDARADEPVAAAFHLFRYAHDRDVYFPNRLEGMPRPVWLLWDYGGGRGIDFYGLAPSDYELLERRGRFALFKRRVTAR